MRKTMATSLAAAFGFVIALLWNTVVQSGFATAGIPLGATANKDDWGGWAFFVVSVIVITVVMVIFILLVSRLAGKEAAKA
jgi:heme/copper-type cytochrome/quinol oxidase subunit 2